MRQNGYQCPLCRGTAEAEQSLFISHLFNSASRMSLYERNMGDLLKGQLSRADAV